MIKNFGENLKNLRKQKDLTQEEIAKIFSVSTQSVSRWETNMGYPDIEMLPAIANFYGVTVDSILCIDTSRKIEKISEIVKEVNSLKTKGDVTKAIEFLREGLKEFPYEFQLMSLLSTCLYNRGDNSEEIKKNNSEVIELCEAILKDCRNDFIRHHAIQLLCYIYPEFGKKDKAIELANQMPTYFVTSNELFLSLLNSSEEKKEYIQSNMFNLLQLISNDIEDLCFIHEDIDKKINILKSLVKIYEGFFDKEDYYFFHCRMHRTLRYIAAIYADIKNSEDAINYLKKAAYHAIAFDTRGDEYIFTSSILNGYKDKITNSSRTSTKNESWVLLEKINDARYDFIRDNARVQEIIQELKKYAKE